ncbi:Leucine-rich repeat protein kinase family protein [Rhynchospora pubera]|uniref:Leucine-rich repeat protein kinase family protein n=1 Tax=Rhynchospora pubera TaxID=906938 RepID=A0AAV8D2S7_9POAL|nr:Leucine-rich repeat protein kinase family protein [Rhynchospora pubera]
MSSSLSSFFLLVLLCSGSGSGGGSSASTTSTASIPPDSSASSDASALVSFKSSADPSNSIPLLFSPNISFCRWPGVACSPARPFRVTRLVLESLALNGTFAPSSLARLDQLRILSLNFNSLAGPVPDLSPLTNLKALFLAHNRFSGPFPASLLSLHRLRTLDLSHNFFTGSLPLPLTRLPRLLVLQLDSNAFTGPVPPFNQSSLKSLNMSSNNLTGPVPATALLSSFGSPSFAANPGLCGEVVRRQCTSRIAFFPHPATNAPSPALPPSVNGPRQGFLLSESSATPSRNPHKRAIIAIGFMSATIFLIGFLTLVLALRKIKRHKLTSHGKIHTPEKSANGSEQTTTDDHEEPTAAMIMEIPEDKDREKDKAKNLGKSGCLTFCAGEAPGYNLEQLMKASAEMLGRGSVGATYKAVLDTRLILCVKRLDAGRIGLAGKEDFERHMEAVGRLRHPNLVPLRAYFHAKEERLLVYDYQPNGSLFSLLHGSKSSRAKPLHWTSCLKIAEDVAQGLSYIHQASRLVHGNIKSSNVILGPDFEACLADCCLSFLLDEQFFETDGESRFYRAPEARESNRRLTPRSDIYAYGVLLLELLTGKSPLDHQDLVSRDLPAWVRSVREEGESVDDERLTMIVDIAAACIQLSPESRPTAWQVLKMIQEVKEAEAGDGDDDSDLSTSNP